MAYRLILLMALFGLLGFGGDRLVSRPLQGVGKISLPTRVVPLGLGEAWDEDPQRVYFRFGREYGWRASLGSSTAYRQLITVSWMAPDAVATAYERWPPRFTPLYASLRHERTLTLGDARVEISVGRYAQNTLDEPAHLYLYADPSRRLHIAWHVVDADHAPDTAVQMLQRLAASFEVETEQAAFAEDDIGAIPEEVAPVNARIQAEPTVFHEGFGVDLHTGDPRLDSLRQRLAAAARAALPEVHAGRFAEADAAVLAVDREIQSAVMLGALYTMVLRNAVNRGERTTRPEYVAALHAHALHWRLRAYPEPHTAIEADEYDAGRKADRAALAALLTSGEAGD